MVRYKLFLTLQDNTGERPEYTLHLSQDQENSPDRIFDYEVREQIRSQLQNQSQRQINETHLSHIVSNWIRDIKLGYRETVISLNLPLISEASIEDLKEGGYRDLPAPIPPDSESIEPQGGALPSLIFS
ncbi:hypothetical protein [Scytonema sp. NUACC26]|uniref:hypothetical protein n=1 Tax=Scytonema sp. NUACC26 TaxID=3140176 RepID=UPI0034DC8D00